MSPLSVTPRTSARRRAGSTFLLFAGLLAAVAVLSAPAPAGAEGSETSMDAIEGFQTELRAELQSRTEIQLAAVVQRTTDRQLAEMRAELDRSDVLARHIAERTDRDLAILTAQAGRVSLAKAQGRRALSIAGRTEPSPQMESGSLALMSEPDEGAVRRHRFDRPFKRTPQVSVGVRVLHLAGSEHPRVAVRVLSVDAAGFDYEVKTFGEPAGEDLRASWVAYADPASAAPASRR